MEYVIYHVNTSSPLDVKNQLLHEFPLVCILDFSKLLCKDQVYYALDRLSENKKQNRLLAKSWPIDLLLELAGTIQIKTAVKLFDITNSTDTILLIVDKEDAFSYDAQMGFPEFLEPSTELIKLYGFEQKKNYCKTIIPKGATARI